MVVELDTTLAELYANHGLPGPIVVDLYRIYTHIDLHDNFPRESVFVEDEDPSTYCSEEEDLPRFKRWALNSRTIRHLPMVGPADVILYLPYNSRDDINRALDQFAKHQRPTVQYVDLDSPNMAKDRKMAIKDKKLVYWRPKSWLVDEDCAVSPELSYMLNDKRFLIHPELPTPLLEMISLLHEDQRDTLVNRPLPFVVKFCRCSSGQGTYIATTEEERLQMLEGVCRYRERGGEDIQVSEFVDSKKPHYGVNFFVGRNESVQPCFLGATEQIVTNNGVWIGGIIDYQEQGELERRLRNTIAAVARTLQQYSYVGWVGIDIIFDSNDRPLVVDLNARIAAGIGIVLFSKHFMSMGLPFARMKTVSFPGPASGIYTALSASIESGQVIVTLSAEVTDTESVASVVFGGRTRDDLNAVADWIEDVLRTCLH
ncbi:hypothetical protein ACN38_g6676 [Penicillium nordicum]|uniref:ATP-grasp domain-containing protein n=2 Tax=Penicillium TaxID=5073 RepID=A0A0M8P2X2_9EURO|nr:hypothetical protein ACN38_g6676 [Penicillium nordicum]